MMLSERICIQYERVTRQQRRNSLFPLCVTQSFIDSSSPTWRHRWNPIGSAVPPPRTIWSHATTTARKNYYHYSVTPTTTTTTTKFPPIITSPTNEWFHERTNDDSKQQQPQRRHLYCSGGSIIRKNRLLDHRHHMLFQASRNQLQPQILQQPQQQQSRTLVSWLPEALQSITIWGGSGYLLKSLHTTFQLPYWACFVAISLTVRTLLFPIVLYAAHNATRFAKIAPDVQFQLALFQKDIAQYRAMKATTRQLLYLMRINLQTLGATYKINKVNPLTVFLSPLLQIPIFWYISIDMRKIVNGFDPLLAQSLVESHVGWIPDLTEADPWYGLPVLAGILLYGNMEVALGKRNMAGEATAKADTAILLKDLFQSLAVFMPCFTAQLPAGVQIYIVTSFGYTIVQSIALRTEAFRQLVGLPSMLTKPGPGRFTLEMMELKALEQKARELRGDGPLLGTGVLVHGWEISFAGKYRPTTIQGSRYVDSDNKKNIESGSATLAPLIPFRIQTSVVSPTVEALVTTNTNVLPPTLVGPYIHGISAPLWQLQQQQQQQIAEEKSTTATLPMDDASMATISGTTPAAPMDDREYMIQHTEDVMEQANRGVRTPTIIQVEQPIRGVPYQPLKKKKKALSTTAMKKKQRGPIQTKKHR